MNVFCSVCHSNAKSGKADHAKVVITIATGNNFFLECVPLGIDKARSLDRLISSLRISREEVIACGDGYNDLSMIRFAGLGVAMANAAKDIQNEADFVTFSNEEDGVAHVIEHFILSPENMN